MTETNVQPAAGVTRELEQQVAFVTGGATGIGLAISRALAARGATVAIFARNATRAEAAAEAIRKSGGSSSITPRKMSRISVCAKRCSGLGPQSSICCGIRSSSPSIGSSRET